jgi:hypothetical protein
VAGARGVAAGGLDVRVLEGGPSYRKLAEGNWISRRTCHRYVQEGIKVLARRVLPLAEVIRAHQEPSTPRSSTCTCATKSRAGGRSSPRAGDVDLAEAFHHHRGLDRDAGLVTTRPDRNNTLSSDMSRTASYVTLIGRGTPVVGDLVEGVTLCIWSPALREGPRPACRESASTAM